MDRSSSRSTDFIAKLDLTKSDDLQTLQGFIKAEAPNVFAVHFAPVCGTCSKARSKPIPGRPAHLAPQELRSEKFPMGLPSLRGLDWVKVQKANILYEATLTLARQCVRFGVPVSIENPKNSIFLITNPMLELFEHCPGYFVTFDSCMMGGGRDKATTWWSSMNIYSALAVRCSKDHSHKPWTPAYNAKTKQFVFPTAEEAAYPLLLCQRVADLLMEYLKKQSSAFARFQRTTCES